jgi:ribonuclease P protein component
MIVPKHRHSSVERNLLKRRLRELLRVELLPVLHASNSSLDVVVRASPNAYARSFSELRDEMLMAAKRLQQMTFVTPHDHVR